MWKKIWAAINKSYPAVWTPNAGVGYFMDHLEAGAFFELYFLYMGADAIAGISFTLLWCSCKEFIFDMIIEHDSILGSLQDTAGYLCGCLIIACGHTWGFDVIAWFTVLFVGAFRMKPQ